MKIMCKDQKTKDLLLQAISEFPDSFGHISKMDILVFGPDTLDIMLDKSSPVTMADYATIKQLYDMEKDHANAFSEMDEFTKARLMRMSKEELVDHYCRGGDGQPPAKEIMLRMANTPDNKDWPERLERVLNPMSPLPPAQYRKIQIYLTSLMNPAGYVDVTEEVLLKIEDMAKSKVAILGGVGIGMLAGLDLAVDAKTVNRFMDMAAMETEHNTDFGRESGKKSRRPMVTSAKGHPYPLPKGPRGMPRISRTRGR